MKVLGVIPARGGSTRLPRKNVLPLNGIPLIAYMIKAASACKRLDHVIVSTEDDEIKQIAKKYGADVPFKRPSHLAENYAMDADILLHAIDWFEEHENICFDVVVHLQPTTPFILPETIDKCVASLDNPNLNSSFAARVASEPPQWMFNTNEEGIASPILGKEITGEATHTQLLDKVFLPTGGAYAVRVPILREKKSLYADPKCLVEMDWDRAVDIDEDLDLMYAEAVAKKYNIRLIGE
ncbi:MAG: acylneuraminate cytidylyltransferase family protein [Methylocystaceae bacterium]|nr:acylneuraminate cytidylyltransferase family protein [Methylocystaceae bacterium]